MYLPLPPLLSDTRKMRDRERLIFRYEVNERKALMQGVVKAIRSTRRYPNRVHVFRFRRYRGHQRRDNPLRRTSSMEPAKSH